MTRRSEIAAASRSSHCAVTSTHARSETDRWGPPQRNGTPESGRDATGKVPACGSHLGVARSLHALTAVQRTERPLPPPACVVQGERGAVERRCGATIRAGAPSGAIGPRAGSALPACTVNATGCAALLRECRDRSRYLGSAGRAERPTGPHVPRCGSGMRLTAPRGCRVRDQRPIGFVGPVG
jgi:hypothetical protein